MAFISAGALQALRALFLEKVLEQKIVPFTLKEVRLLKTLFRNAMNKDGALLLSPEPNSSKFDHGDVRKSDIPVFCYYKIIFVFLIIPALTHLQTSVN